MRESVPREASGEAALRDAARRLDHAVSGLEARLAARSAPSEQALLGQAALEQDRSDLAAQLDAARARERALEEAATAASAALGRAAAEVRLTLGEDVNAGEEEAA